MVAKVKLSYTVELFVKGDSQEAIEDWLAQTTPEEARQQARNFVTEDYNEEIVCGVMDNSDYDIDISEGDE